MAQRIHSDTALIPELVRAQAVPIVATLAGSAMAWLPIVSTVPIVPPLGFMMLLGWRLLRPELWPAWIGIPLGLADDLLSGQPLGTGVFLWTSILLTLDGLDAQRLWRDYWLDWLVAIVAILLYLTGAWWASAPDATRLPFVVMLPQMMVSILSFPIIVRLCVRLDRWRLPL